MLLWRNCFRESDEGKAVLSASDQKRVHLCISYLWSGIISQKVSFAKIIGFKCLLTWGISRVSIPHTIVIRVYSVFTTTTFLSSSNTPTFTSSSTHHSSLQSAIVYRITSSSHDTIQLSLSLQIQHTHRLPDNNRLSAVALLRAWDLCYNHTLTTSSVPGEAIIRIQGLAHWPPVYPDRGRRAPRTSYSGDTSLASTFQLFQ